MSKYRQSFPFFKFCICALVLLLGAVAAPADSSHARVIRLSLVQGDVRFARDVKGDPLAAGKAEWEAAELNLPIRQGYVLATDNGRAEVEFENGAMAFLAENTVLEFYDLSLENGAKITRLVLRQGTGSFYVNPENGDYFSVTSGDFTAEASTKTNFRVDTFDDGSGISVAKGHVSILNKDKTSEVAKGQSYSVKANDATSAVLGHAPDSDDFDRWVSGREDSVSTATVAARQYMSSPNYSSGMADLTSYGSWYSCGGIGAGNCWRPYGMGLGWSPFDSGGWFNDSVFGYSFIGSQPWGWLPYHYGGWVFDPVFGWLWDPSGFGYLGAGGYLPWRSSTGVWMRSRTGLVGIVPVHPLDVRGQAPINLARGVFPVSSGAVSAQPVSAAATDGWKVEKSAPKNTLISNIAVAAPPSRVSRTMVGTRLVTPGTGSSIAYDAKNHSFVNSNLASQPAGSAEQTSGQKTVPASELASGKATVSPHAPSNSRVETAAVPKAPITRSEKAMTPPPAPSHGVQAEARSVSHGGGVGATSSMPAATAHSSAPSHGGSAGHPH
jgi:FecR protein